MSNEAILRQALIEGLDFLTALLDRRADGAIDLLSSGGENIEALLSKALARTTG